jgi:hypothetical protein
VGGALFTIAVLIALTIKAEPQARTERAQGA